jgi:hypothetical protein
MRRGLAVARKRRRLLLCIHEPNYQCGNFIRICIEREMSSVDPLNAGIGTGPAGRSSASDKCQQVRIDHVGIRGHHAVRETRVNLERIIPDQLRL